MSESRRICALASQISAVKFPQSTLRLLINKKLVHAIQDFLNLKQEANQVEISAPLSVQTIISSFLSLYQEIHDERVKKLVKVRYCIQSKLQSKNLQILSKLEPLKNSSLLQEGRKNTTRQRRVQHNTQGYQSSTTFAELYTETMVRQLKTQKNCDYLLKIHKIIKKEIECHDGQFHSHTPREGQRRVQDNTRATKAVLHLRN